MHITINTLDTPGHYLVGLLISAASELDTNLGPTDLQVRPCNNLDKVKIDHSIYSWTFSWFHSQNCLAFPLPPSSVGRVAGIRSGRSAAIRPKGITVCTKSSQNPCSHLRKEMKQGISRERTERVIELMDCMHIAYPILWCSRIGWRCLWRMPRTAECRRHG